MVEEKSSTAWQVRNGSGGSGGGADHLPHQGRCAMPAVPRVSVSPRSMRSPPAGLVDNDQLPERQSSRLDPIALVGQMVNIAEVPCELPALTQHVAFLFIARGPPGLPVENAATAERSGHPVGQGTTPTPSGLSEGGYPAWACSGIRRTPWPWSPGAGRSPRRPAETRQKDSMAPGGTGSDGQQAGSQSISTTQIGGSEVARPHPGMVASPIQGNIYVAGGGRGAEQHQRAHLPEQVMQLRWWRPISTPAGEADQLRCSTVAWRRKGGLSTSEEKLAGMAANGLPETFARRIFAQIQGFGDMAFPESHAASFAPRLCLGLALGRYEPAAFRWL